MKLNYCQNDEVSTDVHPIVHAKWTVRYPHGVRSKLPLHTAPHLTSRGRSYGILNDLRINGFLGDYD